MLQSHRGETGTIRPLDAGEAVELLAHLRRLSPEDRRRRFAHPIRDRAVAAFVDRIDWSRGLMLGYFDRGRLRAALQLVEIDKGNQAATAEFAIQVETGWQGRGIGSALLRKASTMARARGIGRLIFYTLADNDAIKALVSKFGARFFRRGPDVEGVLPLTHPA